MKIIIYLVVVCWVFLAVISPKLDIFKQVNIATYLILSIAAIRFAFTKHRKTFIVLLSLMALTPLIPLLSKLQYGLSNIFELLQNSPETDNLVIWVMICPISIFTLKLVVDRKNKK